jgi:putative intracellular protease/amidase
MRKINSFTTVAVMMAAVILFLSLISIDPAQALGENSSKVLMIPREGYSSDLDLMIKEEVGVMSALLKKAGFEVDIATTSGQPIIGPTRRIQNLLKLGDVDVKEYAGIIMPCMAVGLLPGPPVAPDAVAIVKKALDSGKPVAAALGSVNVLAEAGVLKGKKYSYLSDPLKAGPVWRRTDPRFADGIYIGPGTTQDGNIITCGVCPNTEKMYGWGVDPYDPEYSTIKLTKAFIAALGSGKEKVAAIGLKH